MSLGRFILRFPPLNRAQRAFAAQRAPVHRVIAGLGLVLMSAVKAAPPEESLPFRDVRRPAEERVADLLSRMTLDEKLVMLGGVDGFYLQGIERLGVPRMKMGDGPVGVRNWGPSTLYPATMLLAASWDEALAGKFGTALGRDSRARGMHLSLAPGVNLYRAPISGRNYEYMGEDPFLAGRMAAASIRGVQAQGVAATVKHFAANNSETRRSQISNEIDERTLRELYLPAFHRAVTEGGVWCFMDAYNLLNGEHCTANDWLNNRVLKGEWGFRGVVMSDWHATHDTVGAARGGLDLEMPAPEFFAPEKLKPLVVDGTVPAAVIDDKVRRLLRLIVTNGWLDREQQDKSIPLDDPTSAATALAVAREGITLLKNDGSVLPLDPSHLRRVAVLGPNAFQVVTGLGSGRVRPFHAVNLVDGLRAKLGDSRVTALPWIEPLDYALAAAFPGGLKCELFSGRKQKVPLAVTTPRQIALEWDKQASTRGLTARDLAFARWTGEIVAERDGDYQFVIQAKNAGVRVWVDDVLRWDSLREATCSFVLPFKAGHSHAFRLETEQTKKDISFKMAAGWGPAQPLFSPEEVELVRTADAAVIAVGLNVLAGEGEGNDRPYALVGRQEELIRAVAKINPRTIVVLNSGGSVATAGWIAGVPAYLHAFYPGQEGGTALAEILLGEVNPSGRLPFSYERRWEDCAAFGNYAEDHADESVTKIFYREGIFLGYRWFDHKAIEPLFSFGHGLSYTTFAFSDLRADVRGETVMVTATLKNTGARAGSEVVQLYVGQPQCTVPRPVRELKGFKKVTLAPGAQTRVEIALPRESFAFFHPEKKQWTVEPGDFALEVGASSRDLPLHTTVHFGAPTL